MYYLSYLDINHGIYRGGQIDPPPSIFWFSSTPAGIGLKICQPKSYKYRKYNYNTFLNLNKISAFLDKKCVKKKNQHIYKFILEKFS